MNVALISHEGGGISSVTAGLAASLAKKEVDVTVFTNSTSLKFHEESINPRHKLVYLPILNFPPRNIYFQALNYKKLSQYLSNFDVIHGVSPYTSFGFSGINKKIQRPFVGTIHDSIRTGRKAFINQPFSTWTLSDAGYFFGEFPIYDLSVERVLHHSDRTTLCSYSVLAELAAYRTINYNRVSVIHNGIDFDEINSINFKSMNNDDEVSIIFAGRLFWVKGILLLLQAFRHVKNTYKNVTLKIFGKGPLKQKIQDYIVSYGLADCVKVMGHVSHKELLLEIEKSDILSLPSLCEAQPMIILEAMACKKPVVTFNLPYANEIITDMNTGVLAKPGDIEDLSEKIGLLVSDKQLRKKIGQAAYEHVKKEHNWSIQAEKYLSVYKTVIE
jgi:glycosyltransferase involved in cell wall biosynthesis